MSAIDIKTSEYIKSLYKKAESAVKIRSSISMSVWLKLCSNILIEVNIYMCIYIHIYIHKNKYICVYADVHVYA